MKVLSAIVILSQAAASIAPSAPAKDAPRPKTPAWESRWDDEGCRLIRVADSPAKTAFFITQSPGNDGISLTFLNRSWSKAPANVESVQFVLEPGGIVPGKAVFLPDEPWLEQGPLNGNTLFVRHEDRTLLARIAAAKTVSARENGQEFARVTLPAMTKALAALRECNDNALLRAGIDPLAWGKLRSSPVSKVPPGSLVSDRDYPMAAIRSGEEGTVRVRLSVDATGKVTACNVIETSASATLDSETCGLFRKRARFDPAVDADGTPVPSFYVTRLTWNLSP